MKNRILLALLVSLTFFRADAAPIELPPIPPAPAAPSLPPAPPAPLTLGAQFTDGIRIQDFAKVVLRDVLKAQFVFASDFLSSQAYVGFSASALKKQGTEALLRDVLSQHGFGLEYRAGYYRVSPLRPEDKPDLRKDFIYRVKHRDLGYLSSQLRPLFPDGGFTYQRQAPAADARQKQVGSGGAADARPADDGKSLYSMTTNTDSDLLLFRGLPGDIDRLKGLLTQLDVPVPRVLVRAVVMETRNMAQSGFSVSGVAKLLSNKLSLNISTSPGGPNSLSFSAGNFDAVVNALQGDSAVRVLTAPSVFAETGASASLSVGASVPTLGALQVDGNGKTTQSVQYQDTGVILRVTPRVLDDAISLDVEQEISDAVQTSTGVTGSPTITKSAVKTAFNLKSGDSVILGGLTLDKSTQARDSLPFWRSLTLGRSSAESKSDVVIVLYVERT